MYGITPCNQDLWGVWTQSYVKSGFAGMLLQRDGQALSSSVSFWDWA